MRPYQILGIDKGQNAVRAYGDKAIDFGEKAVAADIQDRAAGVELLDEKLRAQQVDAEVDRARHRETRILTTVQTHPLWWTKLQSIRGGDARRVQNTRPTCREDLGLTSVPVRSAGQARQIAAILCNVFEWVLELNADFPPPVTSP